MVKRDTMVYADEVASVLGIAKETAYKIIRKLNDELAKQNYVTVAGRLPRKYWEEKFYGGAAALYGAEEQEQKEERSGILCQ